jgi:hypothetical protein
MPQWRIDMVVVKKKRITSEISFDYPVELSDEDILDSFANQLIDAASSISSHDIEIVDVDELSESEKSMEKLFEKWVIYLQKLDTFRKGFDVFTNESGKLTVSDLRKIMKGGIDALEGKIDELRDFNEDLVYQMFICTFKAFLSENSVGEDAVKDEDKFREEFECYLHWNIEKLFDFPVLLKDGKTYEVEFNGMNNEINYSIPEQKEFKDKALRFITDEQFDEILRNSWDGSGFFGIIISGDFIIRAIKDKKHIVGNSDMVIGIHDGFNGSGYYKRVDLRKNDLDKDREYGIAIDKAELDWGRYSLGSVFGSSGWEYN